VHLHPIAADQSTGGLDRRSTPDMEIPMAAKKKKAAKKATKKKK
jgi:hypothetical protein